MSVLKVLGLNCSLKSAGGEPSSTQALLETAIAEFQQRGCDTEIVRCADLDILPGVSHDEGPGDAWPGLRDKILGCNILILGTPIWLGQPSSVVKRVTERMDAFLSDTDDRDRMITYGRVGCVAVVGNEDGAHHVSAELYQAMNDVGFSLAPNAVTYWVGEAMHGTDFKDLAEVPKPTARATRMMAVNAIHVARALKDHEFPGTERDKPAAN